jgi:hypothetical protein
MSEHFRATRRSIIAAAMIAATSYAALAQPTPAAPKEADFLFVQSAKGMTFDKTKNALTLTGVSPVTIYFTDRPERIAGNMKTTRFIPFWSEGKDSFKSNPPNADISTIEGSELRQTIVELQDPVLKGNNLTYTVKVLQGTMPETGDDVSVFIDIIGRPFTPMSYAGVARRSFRRGFYR